MYVWVYKKVIKAIVNAFIIKFSSEQTYLYSCIVLGTEEEVLQTITPSTPPPHNLAALALWQGYKSYITFILFLYWPQYAHRSQ